MWIHDRPARFYFRKEIQRPPSTPDRSRVRVETHLSVLRDHRDACNPFAEEVPRSSRPFLSATLPFARVAVLAALVRTYGEFGGERIEDNIVKNHQDRVVRTLLI